MKDITKTIEHLANSIEQYTDKPVIVSGPFGLRAEWMLQCDNKILVVTPEFNADGEVILFYDTGETEERYEPHTIGAINGINNITAAASEDINEIVKLFS